MKRTMLFFLQATMAIGMDSPEKRDVPIWNSCFFLDGGYLIRNQNGFHYCDDLTLPLSMKLIRGFDHKDPNFDIILSYNFQYTLNQKGHFNLTRDQLVLDMSLSQEATRFSLQKHGLLWQDGFPHLRSCIPEKKIGDELEICFEILSTLKDTFSNQNSSDIILNQNSQERINNFLDYALKELASDRSPQNLNHFMSDIRLSLKSDLTPQLLPYTLDPLILFRWREKKLLKLHYDIHKQNRYDNLLHHTECVSLHSVVFEKKNRKKYPDAIVEFKDFTNPILYLISDAFE